MALLPLILLVGGAFAIAMLASETHFGQPRSKKRKHYKSDPGP